MMDFEKSSAFSKTVLSLISGLKAQTEELERVREIYIQMDTNNDGLLQPDEIKKGFANSYELEMAAEDLDHLFDSMDLDKNGVIDFQEFLEATVNR